jgi:uncharacterized protein (DUF2164 family)
VSVQLSKETQKLLTASIKRFAREELELDLGEIKASLVLDFVLKEAGPSIYNQGLEDAGRFFAERVDDLPGRQLKEFGFFG